MRRWDLEPCCRVKLKYYEQSMIRIVKIIICLICKFNPLLMCSQSRGLSSLHRRPMLLWLSVFWLCVPPLPLPPPLPPVSMDTSAPACLQMIHRGQPTVKEQDILPLCVWPREDVGDRTAWSTAQRREELTAVAFRGSKPCIMYCMSYTDVEGICDLWFVVINPQ